MNHKPLFRAATLRINAPGLCGGRNEHYASHGAHFAESIVLRIRRRASTCHLDAVNGVVIHSRHRSRLHANLAPIRLKFFRDQHRQRSVDSLPHFGMVRDHRNQIVASNVHESIQRNRLARRLGRARGSPIRNIKIQQQSAANRRSRLKKIAAFHFRRDAHFAPRALISAAR